MRGPEKVKDVEDVTIERSIRMKEGAKTKIQDSVSKVHIGKRTWWLPTMILPIMDLWRWSRWNGTLEEIHFQPHHVGLNLTPTRILPRSIMIYNLAPPTLGAWKRATLSDGMLMELLL